MHCYSVTRCSASSGCIATCSTAAAPDFRMRLLPFCCFIAVCREEGIKVIETAGHFKGLQPFVDKFKAEGAVIIHKCVTVRHAKSAERMGVDMISMDGFECGGHPVRCPPSTPTFPSFICLGHARSPPPTPPHPPPLLLVSLSPTSLQSASSINALCLKPRHILLTCRTL